HIKFNFIANCAFAEYAILDPKLMIGMPPKLTAFTGLDALTHAVEGYTGTLTNGYVQFFAEKTMDTIAQYLPRAVADGKDLEARGKMAVASNVAGFLLIYGHTNAGHSIGQTIGGYFNIPHGAACAYAEPWVLEYNAPAVPELTKRVGEALGATFTGKETPEEIGTIVRKAFIHFRDVDCKMPSIKTFSFDESKFDEVADACAKEFFQQFNAKKMEKADCLRILQNMYA
ncbi:MAG: iron-containing alcohol dehydrogenase, partial [Oscillospiraceae bacterium]